MLRAGQHHPPASNGHAHEELICARAAMLFGIIWGNFRFQTPFSSQTPQDGQATRPGAAGDPSPDGSLGNPAESESKTESGTDNCPIILNLES